MSASANGVPFEVRMDTTEAKLFNILGSRLFFKHDLERVLAVIAPVLENLQGDSDQSATVKKYNRQARKRVYLSICVFFSDGAPGFFSSFFYLFFFK